MYEFRWFFLYFGEFFLLYEMFWISLWNFLDFWVKFFGVGGSRGPGPGPILLVCYNACFKIQCNTTPLQFWAPSHCRPSHHSQFPATSLRYFVQGRNCCCWCRILTPIGVSTCCSNFESHAQASLKVGFIFWLLVISSPHLIPPVHSLTFIVQCAAARDFIAKWSK